MKATPSPAEPAPGAELIFYEALEQDPGARSAYLDHACGADAALRAEVDALLADHERAEAFLTEEANAGPGTGEPNPATHPEIPGTYIGPYKLLEQIGEGGFGTVWVAEQERPVRRRVALKVIKPGMDTKEVLARFDQERQALALMDHPNIARMFDAGATPLGRPYFVMELVRGVRITEYCDSARLTTGERLKIFMQVCHAVQHAHQKGVIHRDLKPSNILITLHDGVPIPKVIDFGVAKATRELRLTDLTVYTQFQQMIGTPAYMAPEQAEMSELDIDTRSDIYSLGVLLYELLTGKTPFDHERLIRAGCDEMRRVLREEDPPKPSAFVSTMALDLRTDIAHRRSEEGSRLVSLIRGDLDWIAMKALEKDRTRRYDTASSLAEDIDRHLTNEPVQARPQSAGYRFRRLARRNRGVLAAATSVLAALLVGLGAATLMYLKERDARGRAVAAEQAQAAERQKAEQVARFLRDIFEGVQPEVAIGRDTKLLIDIVDRAAARTTTELGSQPATEAEVSLIIGEVYVSLGQLGKAKPHLSRSLELTANLHGKDNLKYAEGLQVCNHVEADNLISERLCRDALALKVKHLGNNHALVAESRALLAFNLRTQGRYPEAEALAREALEVLKKELGPDDPRLKFPLLVLAQAVGWQGRYEESEQLHRESLLLIRAYYVENHQEAAEVLLNLGQNLTKQKRLEEAERAYRDGLLAGQRVFPINHGVMQALRSGLNDLLVSTGRLEEAKAANAEAVQEIQQLPGEQSAAIIVERTLLLGDILERGFHSAAEELAREILMLSREQGKKTWRAEFEVVRSLHNLSYTLVSQGRTDEAKVVEDEMMALLPERENQNPAVWKTFKYRIAEKLSRLGRHAEAAPLYRESYELVGKTFPTNNKDALQSMSGLARALSEWAWQGYRPSTDEATNLSRAREAETLLRECLTTWQKGKDPTSWRVADVQSRLGAAIMVATALDRELDEPGRESRMVEAEKFLLDGFNGLESDPDKDHARYLRDAVERRIRLYDCWNKPAEAEMWRKKLEQLKAP